MSHQASQTGSQSVQNVPSVYSMGQNCPASVSHFQHFSQTGSHNVQTPHNYNVRSVFGVGQNGSANVFQLQMFLSLAVMCRHLRMCPVCIVWGKIFLQVYLRLEVKVCRHLRMCPVFIVWGKIFLRVYLRLAVKVCKHLIIGPVCMVWGKITLQVQLNLKVFFNLNCLRLPFIICPVCLNFNMYLKMCQCL